MIVSPFEIPFGLHSNHLGVVLAMLYLSLNFKDKSSYTGLNISLSLAIHILLTLTFISSGPSI